MVKIYLKKKPINIFCNIDIYEVVEGLSSPCIICSSPFHRSIRVKGKGVYDCPRYKFQHTTFYDSSYCQRMCTSQIGHVKNGKKKQEMSTFIHRFTDCLCVVLYPTREFLHRGELCPMLGTHGEGSLACHTYCDTGHLFVMVISEDP